MAPSHRLAEMNRRGRQLWIGALCALLLATAAGAAAAARRHPPHRGANVSVCATLERLMPKRFARKARHRHHARFKCQMHTVASHAGRPLVFHRGTGTPGPLPPQNIQDHPPVVTPLHHAPLHLARRSRHVTIISLGGSSRTARVAANYPAGFEAGVKLYNSQPVVANPIGAIPNGNETSEADGDGVIFYAGNFFAAYANAGFFSNGGAASFTPVDPRAVPDKPPAGMRFCCDQVVQFIPNVHLFVWVIQYVNASPPTQSVIRVAVASPQSILASGNTPGAWAYTDLMPSQVNRSGDWFDYPDVEYDANNLFVTINDINKDGTGDASTIVRMSLRDLVDLQAAHGPGPGSEPFRWYSLDDPGLLHGGAGTFRAAQDPDLPASTFFVTPYDEDTIRVWVWPDSSDSPSYTDVDVPTIGNGGLYATAAGQGINWIGPLNGMSSPDNRPLSVTTSELLWPHLLVAWDGGTTADGTNEWAQPHIEMADINLDPSAGSGNLTLNQMYYLTSNADAVGRPELATNEFGDVGISYWHGEGGGATVEHAIGALGYGRAGDAGAPLEAKLGPDTTSGVNAAGGGDYTALRLSYLTPRSDLANRPGYACFSEAEYVTQAAGLGNADTWDTFGPPDLPNDCGANTSAPPGPPGPPLGGPQDTRLSLGCPNSVQAGQAIVVSGTLSYTTGGGGVGNRPIVVDYKNGAVRDTVITDPNGRYTDMIVAGPPPTWSIHASFGGDQFANPSVSLTCNVSIQPAPPPQGQPSSISLNCPTGTIYAHIGTLGVSGAIAPERDGAPVAIVYTQPDGTQITDNTSIITSGPFKGSYLDDITPEEPGTWHIWSSWPGDATYAGNSSPQICSVTVSPRPPP